MITNFKKIIFVIISASFFITFSVITKADVMTYAKTYLAPVIAGNMNGNQMVKDTPFCKGFYTKELVANWAVQTYFLYTYNAKDALVLTGQSNSCGTMDLYENRNERNNMALNQRFITKEQRYKAAIDLFVTRCFINGDALQQKMLKAAMQTAKIIPCSDFSIISGEVATATRNFNF